MEQSEAQRQFSEASAAYAAGQYEHALSLLDQLDATYPNQTNVLHARAKCLIQLGRNEDAQFTAGQLAALGDARADEIRQALAAQANVANVPVRQSPQGARRTGPVLVAIGIVVGLLVIVGLVMKGQGQPNKTTQSTNKAGITSTPAAIANTSQTPGQLDEATARGTSWMPEKGLFAELLAEHGPPQDWPGEWPAFPLESKTIPNKDYPDGKCDIWVPTNEVRQAYLKQSFHPTPYKGRTATEADVKKDLNQYGYYYSEFPPAYLAELDYTEYNEEPIYPFIGQMVPGTNVQYQTPPIPAVWLVDLTPDGKTIPALTTIDPRKFRSINWPRARYADAVKSASEDVALQPLYGRQSAPFLHLEGLHRFSGDYEVTAQNTLDISPGTVLIMDANSDVSAIGGSRGITEGRIEIIVSGGANLILKGTEQRPIIWSSGSTDPQGRDWAKVGYFPGASCGSGLVEFNLFEYGFTEFASASIHVSSVRNNIFRYAEKVGRPVTEVWPQTIIFLDLPADASVAVIDNEIHNNDMGLEVQSGDYEVSGNTIFCCGLANADRPSFGFRYGILDTEGRSPLNFHRNIIHQCNWGIEACAGKKPAIRDNVFSCCQVAIMLLPGYPAMHQIPEISDNRLWGNLHLFSYQTDPAPPEFVHAPNVPLYQDANRTDDTLYRNARIFDFEPLAGWPEER